MIECRLVIVSRNTHRLLLPALTVALGLILTSQVTAQTFTNLYGFTGGNDGGAPYAGLILSGNTLYGTTTAGGSSSNGTVFAVNTDGSGFTNLYGFTGGSDGGAPYAGLILSSNTLYGTASGGGSSGNRSEVRGEGEGWGFPRPPGFSRSNDGGGPEAGLFLSGKHL